MANSHGLTPRLVKKQAAARKLSKGKKKSFLVYTWNESKESRYNLSYKKRARYFQNKQAFPPKKLPSKNIDTLVELGIIDDRGFFRKGKKKNYITKRMTDQRGLDYYGLPR
jgi:hypothetical protein